jgi:hypothetical protein
LKYQQLFECPSFSMYHLWKRQTFAKSIGNGSNLNYSCLIDCSWFFKKNHF